jgi:hypothetical protein
MRTAFILQELTLLCQWINIIGNRTRDLSACNTVPQTTVPTVLKPLSIKPRRRMPNSYSSPDANREHQIQDKYCFVAYGNNTANGVLVDI